MISLLAFGFLLGIRHALEADHIATFATLVSTEASHSRMLRQAFAWGLGHSLTLLLFGLVVLTMDQLISESLALGLEACVGVIMIALGLDVIRRALKSNFHFHVHKHADGKVHLHGHSHTRDQIEQHQQKEAHEHAHHKLLPLRTLLIGMVHGAAGSAALMLLFIDKIESFALSLGYILLFGAGSIIGMLAFSLVISVPMTLASKYLSRFYRYLQIVTGLLTAGIGSFWLVKLLS